MCKICKKKTVLSILKWKMKKKNRNFYWNWSFTIIFDKNQLLSGGKMEVKIKLNKINKRK